MDELKAKLINDAKSLYGKIKPCGKRVSFDECFTVYQGKILFWFNSSDDSTKILSETL
jgi:hypothetical protein